MCLRRLDLYVLKEIAPSFFGGLALFFVVIAFAQSVRMAGAMGGLGMSTYEMAQAWAYSALPLLGVLLPVAGLFSTLLCVGRLKADNEVLGLLQLGITLPRLLRVPVGAGGVLMVASFLSLAYGEPWGVSRLRALITKSAQRALAQSVVAKEFIGWLPGVTFFAGDSSNGCLKKVAFADYRDDQAPVLVTAQQGHIVPGEHLGELLFDLESGTLFVHRPKQAGQAHLVRFGRATYRLDVGWRIGQSSRSLSNVQEYNLGELHRRAVLAEAHHDTMRAATLKVVLYRKFAVPVSAPIFAGLAVPLALGRGPGQRARAPIYAGGLAAMYYYVGRSLELAARTGTVSAAWAAWLPDIVGACALLVGIVWLCRCAHR